MRSLEYRWPSYGDPTTHLFSTPWPFAWPQGQAISSSSVARQLQELWNQGCGSENAKSGDLELYIQFRPDDAVHGTRSSAAWHRTRTASPLWRIRLDGLHERLGKPASSQTACWHQSRIVLHLNEVTGSHKHERSVGVILDEGVAQLLKFWQLEVSKRRHDFTSAGP